MIFKNNFNFTLFLGLSLLAAAPLAAHADLIYSLVDGTGLIYDTTDHTTWTQNANISGSTFTYQGAKSWAASLTIPGVNANWELPTGTQFRDLFLQLEGNGGNPSNPYTLGGGFEYGPTVSFGAGPNDYVSNVAPEYWTSTSGSDFNFYYGYPGGQPDSNLYAAWAVEATPEPASGFMGLITLGLLVGGLGWRPRAARA